MSAPPATAQPGGAERKRGYQRWRGERSAHAWRWWVIARGNLALALANRWVKITLVASLIPGVILSGITYFFLPLSAAALDGVLDASLLFVFLVAALVGARLVSEDRRQGAFLAHFSRPVTRLDYLVGKFVALALPLLFVTTASSLWAIGVDASVDSTTFAERIGDVSRQLPDQGGYLRQATYTAAIGAVFAFGVVTSVATAGIVLGVSALTTRTRIAGIIWFAIVAFGAAAHGILQGALREDWPALLSWMDNLQDVSSFLLGLPHNPSLDQSLEFALSTRVALLLLVALAGLVVVHEQLRRAEGGAR